MWAVEKLDGTCGANLGCQAGCRAGGAEREKQGRESLQSNLQYLWVTVKTTGL